MQWCLRISLRCRHTLHDGTQDVRYTGAGLARGPDYFLAAAADEIDDLILHHLGIGRIKIALVDHRNDLKVVVDGHVEVGNSLGLYALRSIDNQERSLAGRDRTRNFVGKVDVSRGVDKIEHVFLAVQFVIHLDGMALNCDTAFALEIHIVEHLRLHIFGGDSISVFKQTVGQR